MMVKHARKSRTVVLIFVLYILVSSVTVTQAHAVAPSYNYSYWNESVAAPSAYEATALWNGEQIGAGAFKEPSDIYVTPDHTVYVLDSGNNRIVVTDRHFHLLRIIDSFRNGGQEDRFLNPQGLYVTDDHQVYVADTGNRRVVHLDRELNPVKIIDPPESELLPETFVFQPAKVVADKAGRLYVLSIGVFDGFMEFNADGSFTTFFGANRVFVDPIEYLWKMLSTREQRSRMVQFIPTEFTNLDIDEDGFVYATNGDRFGDPIKKLNAQGTDILRRDGYSRPRGDVRYFVDDGPSRLIDIDVTDSEIYSVLDSRRGRIFTYNGDGYLLYIFGGLGNRIGEFTEPIAIERLEDRFLVLDKALGEITVFETTEYGRTLNEAVRSYYAGDEEKASEMFKKAANMNANLEYAYSGFGKAMFRQGNYEEAMLYFEQSMDRKNYSKAFVLHRRGVMREYFPTVMTGAFILLVVVLILRKFLKGKGRKNVVSSERKEVLRFPFHLIVHPFKGFWELKYERNQKINLRISFVILAVLSITNILRSQYSGFLVNFTNPNDLNSLMEIAYVVVPVLFWCTANWSLTTLMDGEGKFKEIFMSTCFALIPLIIIHFPWIWLSNFISMQETAFYYLSNSVAAAWSLFLLFVGNMTVHQFTPSKTVGIMLLTVLAMGFMAFLCLLFFSLVQQIAAFATTIYQEIMLRG